LGGVTRVGGVSVKVMVSYFQRQSDSVMQHVGWLAENYTVVSQLCLKRRKLPQHNHQPRNCVGGLGPMLLLFFLRDN
jgi:hypothetical protein